MPSEKEAPKYLGELKAIEGMTVQIDFSLGKVCSWHTGGPADIFAQVDTFHALKAFIECLNKHKIEHMIVGKGSNILFSDNGYRGAIIRLGKEFQRVTVSNDHIVAGSAASLANLVRVAEENSLTGLEFAAGIPGTFGGALAGNAGAYGIDIFSLVSTVHMLDNEMEMVSVSRDKIEHGYRHSDIGSRGVILEAELRLTLHDKDIIRKDMDAYFDKRRSSQPYDKFTAGSVFKNPLGYSAGKLIEESGLKGYTKGGARISPLHANFIENISDASSDDIYYLIFLVQQTVREKKGVILEPEVRFVGRFDMPTLINIET